MDKHIIQTTIDDLEHFLSEAGQQLSIELQKELRYIIDRLINNLDKPDKRELMEIVIMIGKIILEGSALLHHHPS